MLAAGTAKVISEKDLLGKLREGRPLFYVAERMKGVDRPFALWKLRTMTEDAGVGLMMNVARKDLPGLLQELPALQKPTVSSLSDEDWVDVNTIVEEKLVRTIVPQLKAAGAEGIVEYAINKLIDALNLRLPADLDAQYKFSDQIPADQRPVVFIGPYEHHSNELPWRESIADVVTIDEDADGHVDLDQLPRQYLVAVFLLLFPAELNRKLWFLPVPGA